MAKRNSTAPHGAKVLPFRPRIVDRAEDDRRNTVNSMRDLANKLSQESGTQGAVTIVARKDRPLGMQTTGRFAASDDRVILALLKSLHCILHLAER